MVMFHRDDQPMGTSNHDPEEHRYGPDEVIVTGKTISGGTALLISIEKDLGQLATKIRESPIENMLKQSLVADLEKMMFEIRHHVPVVGNKNLTECETEILKLIAEGHLNKQIAGIRNITEQTVKNHITSILLKLSASNRTHAVMLAREKGLI